MNILIGLIPALLWGIMPLIVSKTGGKPINQLIGTTTGALIVGAVLYVFLHPTFSGVAFFWCFLSGVAWTFGQLSQYSSFPMIGVSRAMPISTGAQLVGTSIVGVLFFHSWPQVSDKFFGFLAIIIIIIGVFLTTKTDKKDQAKGLEPEVLRKGTIVLLLGTIGYMGFSGFPQIPQIDGFSAFIAQSLGMFVTSMVMAFFYRDKNGHLPILDKKSIQNIWVGIDFGISTAVYLVSTKLNGVSTGFTISQMCVIVSTLSGIFFLGEKKSKKGLTYVMSGLLLVVLGGVISGIAKG